MWKGISIPLGPMAELCRRLVPVNLHCRLAGPFRRLPDVLALPHLGSVTEANDTRFCTDAVDDIRAFDAGAPVRMLTPD